MYCPLYSHNAVCLEVSSKMVIQPCARVCLPHVATSMYTLMHTDAHGTQTFLFFYRLFGQFSMEVILATAFGQKVQILQGEANELTKAAKSVIDGFSQLHGRGPLLLALILGELLHPCSSRLHAQSKPPSYHRILSQNFHILFFIKCDCLYRKNPNSSLFGPINNQTNIYGPGIFVPAWIGSPSCQNEEGVRQSFGGMVFMSFLHVHLIFSIEGGWALLLRLEVDFRGAFCCG